MVETLAFQRCVSYLALDTSEDAAALIRFYAGRGYEQVDFVRWSGVNYRSVILAKARARLPTKESWNGGD